MKTSNMMIFVSIRFVFFSLFALENGTIASKKLISQKFIAFENSLPSRKPQTQPLVTISNAQMTLTHCSMLCSFNSSCLSLTFCGNRICHLNADDANSPGAEMQDDPTCVYVGMKNTHEPHCNVEADASVCDISSKVLGQISQWVVQSEIDNEVEYKVSQYRSETSDKNIEKFRISQLSLSVDGLPEVQYEPLIAHRWTVDGQQVVTNGRQFMYILVTNI